MEQKRQQLWALLMAVGGGMLMILVLNMMHQPMGQPPKKEISQVEFAVKRNKARAEQKIVIRPRPEKAKPAAKTLQPRLDLAFASGGLDLGVDILGLAATDSSLLNQQSSVMTEDTVDELPQILFREPIPFPEAAKEKNVTGFVTVNLLINQEGRVDKVKLIDADPEGYFEQAALQGVQSWTFSPAEYQGRLVSVWVKQKIKFQVN